MSKIREILKPAFIQLTMKATEKEGAIKELLDTFVSKSVVTNDNAYFESVMKREAESTTGIGFGVAIPHGKSSAVTVPSLAFGRSQSGVSWDSMDGKAVQLIFLIAVPESSNNEHLRILSQLSRKLMHETIRKQLMEATEIEEIYQILE